MINTNKTKDKIIQSFIESITGGMIELDSINKDIELSKQNLSDINKSYIEVYNTIKIIKENSDNEIVSIKKDREQLNKDVNSFIIKTDDFYSNIKTEENKLKKIIEQRSSIQKEISNYESRLSELKNQVNVKDSLNLEINNLNNTIQQKKDELSNIVKQNTDVLKISLSDIENANKELESIKSDIEKEKSIVVPKMKELDEREKKLIERENDIQIIIERYKKLYADKGVSFKI